MSDFDEVLERLLTDPAFAAALAADPDAALAGYRLDPGEVVLLRSQLTGDPAATASKVETRANQSSTAGLLASFGALGGHAGFGPAPDPRTGFGPVPGGAGGSIADVRAGVGDAPGERSGFGSAPAHHGFGASPSAAGLGDRPHGYAGEVELKGYHDRVDADGDGSWDQATYYRAPDGGVDIVVDLDHDGRPDFVGHDADRDRRVEHADYDTDHDGVLDTRRYDTDHDGWLDRSVRRPPQR